MDFNRILEIQREFDRKMGWDKYENCETPEEVLNFMEHLVLVTIDELGEISRVRKRFLRDKQSLDVSTLRKEMVDIFIFAMQGSMCLKMNLEKEYIGRMTHNKERFLKPPQEPSM